MIYWTAIFGHRKCSGEVSDKTGEPGGYRNPPGGIWALVGLSGREEKWPEMGRAPLPPWSELDKERGTNRENPSSSAGFEAISSAAAALPIKCYS